MRRRHRGGTFFGPVVLIGLGVVFLLHNLGLGDWDAWTLIQRFWPILFVAAGLDIWFGRRSVLNALWLIAVTVVLLFAIGFGLRLAEDQFRIGWEVAPVEISQPVGDVSQAEVTIQLAVGTLRLEALPESAPLVAGTIYADKTTEPDMSFHQSDDTAYFVLRQAQVQLAPLFERWDGESAWRLGLNRDIPMRLSVATGVGLSELDLSQLTLTDLRVQAGVGQTTVTLPANGQLQAHIQGGLGDLIIQIPKGMAARIENQSGLVETQIRGDYTFRDGVYRSPGYDAAENRVDLTVSGGAGLIKIRQVDGD